MQAKLRYIDSLRGLAILAVLMVHCGQYGINKYPDLIANIINTGGRGVQLFFVASAFTLFLSLARRSETVKSNFYIRRFFRIAPMYYLGIAYYLMQDGYGPRYWLGDAPGITSWHIFANV